MRLTRSVLRMLLLATSVAAAGSCFHTRATPTPPTAVPPTKPDHELGAETGTPVSSTPEGLLHDGAETRIQERLRAKRLLAAGQVTGRLDTDTREALRAFQKDEGLPTTGLPSYETIEHLGLKLDTIFRTTAHSADAPPARARANER